MIATSCAALTVAERYGLPAPRLLGADLTARSVGMPITAESAIIGARAWPVDVSRDLIRAAGAAIAEVHPFTLPEQPALPFRPRPIAVDDFAAARRPGRMPSTDLLHYADEQVSTIAMPESPTVFVHGDVWPGNIVVVDGTIRVLIDWKTAGVGHPGVDLGELRKQVAIAYVMDAPRYVLEGWERASGTQARDVAFWDATASLNTPTNSNGSADAVRRDEFLIVALSHLWQPQQLPTSHLCCAPQADRFPALLVESRLRYSSADGADVQLCAC